MKLHVIVNGIYASLALILTFMTGGVQGATSTNQFPNILFILADDLGYGDVKCLNPAGKIPTPHIDRLAAGGMIFTDCHSSSSVCTPSRYSIMTGRYNWRSRLQSSVLGGYSKHLIENDRLTVAALLQKHNYYTAAFGKWHLGMDWPLKDGGIATDYEDQWNVDYTKPIQHGPNWSGFSYYFGISASLDMPPYIFIENNLPTSVPTVEKTWIRKGPAAQDFEAIDVLPVLVNKVVNCLEERSKTFQKSQPFFIYLPLASPHTPILPTAQWRGRSKLNPYADFVMQTDDAVGQILDALDRNHFTDNTLVIFTSDNGCSPAAKVEELTANGHHPSAKYRGYKADIWDGGHRIPFIARWPGQIKAGSRTAQLAGQVDFMATCAEILGAKLPENAGEDSISMLSAFLGTENSLKRRNVMVHHSIEGRFSIRQDNWKLVLCPGSGGWSVPRDPQAATQGLPSIQLYNLANDIGEQDNVKDKHPDVVDRLTQLLEKYAREGRSTPGTPQKNTVNPDLFKKNKDKPAKTKTAA